MRLALKTELGAVLIMALVVGGLGLGSFMGTSGRQSSTPIGEQSQETSTTAAATPASVCGNAAPYARFQQVMSMSPGSSGIVCVMYDIGSAQQENESWVVQQTGHVYLLGPNGTVVGGAEGINVTVLSVTRTQDNESVEYRIAASSDADGAYSWWLTGSSCPGFPLVVGNVTSATPILRSYFSSDFYCPAMLYAVEIDGASGVALQTFPS